MTPIRILQVTSVLNFGGIENTLMNIFRNIDRTKIVFDFLVIKDEPGYFEEEIMSLGGKIYRIPSIRQKGYFKFKQNLNHFFKTHTTYTIVHSHVNALSGIVLDAAMKNGVSTRIAHSHTSFPHYNFFEKILKNFFRKKIPYVSTDLFACSENAAKWLFGEHSSKAVIVNNGVDPSVFSFSSSTRAKMRKILQIENKFVIINTGRFSKEKNHSFLISIFNELLKKRPDSILLCMGNGKEKKQIKKLVQFFHIEDKVIFKEASKDVNSLLCAADVYVSPSLFEGFGLSAAEAQFCSLPCVLSDSHPQEIDISDSCVFLSTNDSAKLWAEQVLILQRNPNIAQKCLNSNFLIDSTARFLCDFYYFHYNI